MKRIETDYDEEHKSEANKHFFDIYTENGKKITYFAVKKKQK